MDKNLDQLDPIAALDGNDILHVRRLGKDYQLKGSDLTASLPESVQNGVNVGTGAGKVFKSKLGSNLQFKSISGSGNISVSNGTDNVVISVSPDSTKANKVSPSATGNVATLDVSGDLVDSGVNIANVLVDISGESIGDLLDVSLAGIASGDYIVWDGTSFVKGLALTVASIANVGTGEGVYKGNVAGAVEMKTLKGGAGISLTTSTDEIEVAALPYGSGVAWQTPTLLNSWTSNASYPARYRVVGDIIHLEGVIDAGAKTDGTVVFQLGVGERPSALSLIHI